MIRRIQQRPRRQRKIIFGLLFGGGLLLILLITAALLLLSLNTNLRDQSVALVEGVRVREFAVLPDDDAYPASVAVGPDGTVYTGSFVSGAIWSITPDGVVTEIPGTRGAIGAVAGLTIGPDGTLYVVDQLDSSTLTQGGRVIQITFEDDGPQFTTIDDKRGFLLPDDVALDGQGNLYVSDRGRAEVWRYTPDDTWSLWWPPASSTDVITNSAPTGLAYDPGSDSLIITDSQLNSIQQVEIATGNTTLLYWHGNRDFAPGFDGVTVDDDGQIYVAAMAQNGLALLKDGELDYIAGVFRGISDVAYDGQRLFAANFDSFSLVVNLVRPQLPFALDVIEFLAD